MVIKILYVLGTNINTLRINISFKKDFLTQIFRLNSNNDLR